MKENEFDIYVRNLMQEAEETVSPGIWEGISAGLAPRKRVIPAWVWRAGAGMAAAAAIALGAFLFPKNAHNSDPITILNPVAGQVPVAPVENAARTGEEEILPILEQVSRRAERTVYVPPRKETVTETPVAEEVSATKAPAGEAPLQEAVPSEIQPIAPPEAAAPDRVEEEDPFNQLAFEQRKQPFHRHFALSAGGNLQGNERPEIASTSTIRRAAPLYTAPMPEQPVPDGLSKETPEAHFSLPFTVGLGVTYRFAPRWSVGTGLQYTNMSRTFMANYGDAANGISLRETSVDNHQHWIGIPLTFHYKIVRAGRWSVNSFVGGTAEYLINNQYLIQNAGKDIHYEPKAQGLQWSAGAGIGVQFQLSPSVGLYLDPSLRYYFDCDQPRSIRTIQPLRFDLQAGLRFSFGL